MAESIVQVRICGDTTHGDLRIYPARFLDNWEPRNDIPRIKQGFNDGIDPSSAKEHVRVTIAPPSNGTTRF